MSKRQLRPGQRKENLWGCQICGNDYSTMTKAEHAKLGCAEKWAQWNRQQFSALAVERPALTEGMTPV